LEQCQSRVGCLKQKDGEGKEGVGLWGGDEGFERDGSVGSHFAKYTSNGSDEFGKTVLKEGNIKKKTFPFRFLYSSLIFSFLLTRFSAVNGVIHVCGESFFLPYSFDLFFRRSDSFDLTRPISLKSAALLPTVSAASHSISLDRSPWSRLRSYLQSAPGLIRPISLKLAAILPAFSSINLNIQTKKTGEEIMTRVSTEMVQFIQWSWHFSLIFYDVITVQTNHSAWVEISDQTPVPLRPPPPGKSPQYPFDRRLGGPCSGLGNMEKKAISNPRQESSPVPSVVQPKLSHYTELPGSYWRKLEW
jgi:hypothetical protein